MNQGFVTRFTVDCHLRHRRGDFDHIDDGDRVFHRRRLGKEMQRQQGRRKGNDGGRDPHRHNGMQRHAFRFDFRRRRLGSGSLIVEHRKLREM